MLMVNDLERRHETETTVKITISFLQCACMHLLIILLSLLSYNGIKVVSTHIHVQAEYLATCYWCMTHTVVSRVSTHGSLNITCEFGPHGRLPGIKISCLYRSCYIDSLKCSTWVLTREWALAQGHYGTFHR